MIWRLLPLGALAAAQVVTPAPTPPAPAPIVAQVPEIVASFPHDVSAFTEGLLIDRGRLYESTGREGESRIREVDLASGRTLRETRLPDAVFGEGIVAWRDTLVSVTWRGGLGYRWAVPSLKRIGSFRYEGEGWGMTDDGTSLILSDGTPVLRFLDPATLKVARRVSVTANGRPVRDINELEYVDGEILANLWRTAFILRIDPATGQVRGAIDLSDLVAKIGASDTDSVPNGIAYDRQARRLFVTGKNWPNLFEIRLPNPNGNGGNGGR